MYYVKTQCVSGCTSWYNDDIPYNTATLVDGEDIQDITVGRKYTNPIWLEFWGCGNEDEEIDSANHTIKVVKIQWEAGTD